MQASVDYLPQDCVWENPPKRKLNKSKSAVKNYFEISTKNRFVDKYPEFIQDMSEEKETKNNLVMNFNIVKSGRKRRLQENEKTRKKSKDWSSPLSIF